MTPEERENYQNNYNKLFEENIKLTIFYSQLMNFLYRETKLIDDSFLFKYKIVENEKYIEMEKNLT